MTVAAMESAEIAGHRVVSEEDVDVSRVYDMGDAPLFGPAAGAWLNGGAPDFGSDVSPVGFSSPVG